MCLCYSYVIILNTGKGTVMVHAWFNQREILYYYINIIIISSSISWDCRIIWVLFLPYSCISAASYTLFPWSTFKIVVPPWGFTAAVYKPETVCGTIRWWSVEVSVWSKPLRGQNCGARCWPALLSFLFRNNRVLILLFVPFPHNSYQN